MRRVWGEKEEAVVTKQLRPGDPEVVAAVIERIRNMSREELLERLRRRPDFDEAWVGPPGAPTPRAPRKVATVAVRNRLRKTAPV